MNMSKTPNLHLGIPLAQFFEIFLAAARVEAFCSKGISFHILDMIFEESMGYQGTGGRI